MNKVFNTKFYITKSLFLALVLTFFAPNISHAAKTTSSITIDAQTGDVLASQNADELRYPASLTKLMTLYITFNALEKGIIHLEDELPVSRKAANRAPSRLGLRAGQKVTVKTAVMALVVKSANDCATVLAEGLGYSEENFAKTMTSVAKELGMKNTTFKNASGLPHKEQKTTARDMALLGAAMYHHFPKQYKLFSAKSFEYQGRKYYTHNHLLKTFEGADGMKTGFTNAAGYNIVTSATRNGQRVIAVTMGHNTAKLRDKKVATLMNQGLTKLVLASQVENSNIYAKIEEPSQNKDSNIIETAQNEDNISPSESIWGIQIGAFSNYAKARNYAVKVKKEIKRQYANKTVDIEPYQKGSAVVYRSKLIGFEKNEADNACKSLKKSKKSCIVIANNNHELVLAHNETNKQSSRNRN